MRGRLINIEGTDGAGKDMHAKLILKRLNEAGFTTKTISFPTYGTPSCAWVERYLNGEYGSPGATGPWFPSLLYAYNRWMETGQMRDDLGNGISYVLDRYTASNIGHQGAKFTDDRLRQQYIDWLLDLELRRGVMPDVREHIARLPAAEDREVFTAWAADPVFIGTKIPTPDITVFIDMPPAIGQQFVARKRADQRTYLTSGKKRDIHEDDKEHLLRARTSYRYAASVLPGWVMVDPVRPELKGDADVLNNPDILPEEKVRTPTDINDEIYARMLRLF